MKQIFYLTPTREDLRHECLDLIQWHYSVNGCYTATRDLIHLIEQAYFFN